MKHLFVILAIASLACMATPQVEFTASKYVDTQIKNEVSTEVKMTVVADEGLNIRTAPGENNPVVDGPHILRPGDVVTCTEMKTGGNLGDSIWCHHERGWSNARWLEAQ